MQECPGLQPTCLFPIGALSSFQKRLTRCWSDDCSSDIDCLFPKTGVAVKVSIFLGASPGVLFNQCQNGWAVAQSFPWYAQIRWPKWWGFGLTIFMHAIAFSSLNEKLLLTRILLSVTGEVGGGALPHPKAFSEEHLSSFFSSFPLKYSVLYGTRRRRIVMQPCFAFLLEVGAIAQKTKKSNIESCFIQSLSKTKHSFKASHSLIVQNVCVLERKGKRIKLIWLDLN